MPVKYDTSCPFCKSPRVFEEKMCEGVKGKKYKRFRLVCTKCKSASGWHKRKYECQTFFKMKDSDWKNIE